MSQVLAETFEDLDEFVENLVTEDDTPVDNIFSAKEQRLLTEILYSSWTPTIVEDNSTIPRAFFADANIGLYYSKYESAYVPDVLVSLDVSAPRDLHAKRNRSYIVWEFGKMPELVVEIVSNKEGGELTTKLRDYARIGIQYYIIHDPMRLLSDDVLRVYEPGLAGRYYLRNDYQLPNLELGLMLWRGEFEGTESEWLRWIDKNGELLLTPDEKLTLQLQRAEHEAELRAQADERAAQAEERALVLAEKLRAAGIDPNEI